MKKNKAYIFFFFFLFFKTSLYAQYCDTFSFQKMYRNLGAQDTRAKNIYFNAAGNIYLVGLTESAVNYSADAWIMKTTPNGKIIWSKTIGMQGDETVNGIKYTADGGFIIAGNTNSLSTFSQGWIVKTDSNAVVQWSIILGAQYSNVFQIVQLNDGGYAASGILYTDFSGNSSGVITAVRKATNIILRLDKNGNTRWWKSFRYSNYEGLKTISQLKDGALLVTGLVNDAGDGYVIKLNEINGDMIWMNQYMNTGEFIFPHAVQQPDSSIHLHVGNKIFFLSANGKFYDGKQINLNSAKLDLDKVQVSDIGLIAKETEMYHANLYPLHSPIVFAVNNDSVVIWAHQYKPDATNLQRFINGRIYKKSIYLTGSYFQDNASGDELTYLIKADTNGYTLCSDTFNVSFRIKTISYPENITHGWMNEGALQPQFVYPYTETVTAEMQLDCAVESCCRPVVSNTSVLVCAGDNYKLPNDSIVTTTGLYTLNYHTWGGCDSVLNYNINFKKLFNFSLGNDTCFINNQPVIFSVPEDSNVTYRWQDGSSLNNFTATHPGKYWVTATSSCNIFKDSVTVNAVCSLPVYAPSAFTPNNDGLNDIFKPLNLNGQRLINLSIFNRYGNRIFFSANSAPGWDGTYNGIKQPSGTYIYTVIYFDFGGTLHALKGTVVLIR